MIDPITSPGMAVDIRLSTLESVQQLGPRLAHILGAELSRMRADLAFASTIGIAVQSTHAEAESLRAQQSTLLGHHLVSLTTQTAVHAELARRSYAEPDSREDEKPDQASEQDEEPSQGETTSEEQIEQGTDESLLDKTSQTGLAFTSCHDSEALAKALSDALKRFSELMRAAELTGLPMAIALPAERWLEQYAPAGLRPADTDRRIDERADILVLCLGFEGCLAIDHHVWGFVYQQMQCVGQVEGQWMPDTETTVMTNDSWHMSVADTSLPLSKLTCCYGDSFSNGEAMDGLRVRLENSGFEYRRWTLQLREWTWQ
ncbi:MAG: hypothetical protein AB8B87_09090 [Granulosicoccus sp.]